MTTPQESALGPRSSLIHLPEADALQWITQQLAKNNSFKLLHRHFEDLGFTFYLERSQVFVSIGSDASGKLIPSVLGIVPSFVPVTPIDKEHSAVGISVNHTGDAVAATVTVSHSPFGVTDFTLHVIDPETEKIRETSLSTIEIAESSLADLSAKLNGSHRRVRSSSTNQSFLRHREGQG